MSELRKFFVYRLKRKTILGKYLITILNDDDFQLFVAHKLRSNLVTIVKYYKPDFNYNLYSIISSTLLN